jgi:hypothetical protein
MSGLGGTQYSKKSYGNQESEAMKLVSQKMHEISSFPNGETPDPECLMEIIKPKNKF